jgi:hypothetical protein
MNNSLRCGVAALCLVGLFTIADAEAADHAAGSPYKEDPAILTILDGLGDRACTFLPPMRTAGKGMKLIHGFQTRGPKVRDYGNKMAYAPDRGTGMYCGANHGAPSRLNDVTEYHLGSNTWHVVEPPAGGDHGRVYRARGAIRKGKDVEKHKAFLRTWYTENVAVADGYVQTKANGGPVGPWHTWDGICYDHRARALYWAVLDSDERGQCSQLRKLKEYCTYAGQDFDELKKTLKPGAAMYMYDTAEGRWFRHTMDKLWPYTHQTAADKARSRKRGYPVFRRPEGQAPDLPYMRGMGGSLVYLPDREKTIWYCAAQNVTPNDFEMWQYDSAKNEWTDLKPNGGTSLRHLVHKEGRAPAPRGELQMAYSPKHEKIVCVSGSGTWIYDVAKNEWAKAVEDKENKAHDAVTVFAYDSVNDVFLLLNAPDRWKPERVLRAYSIDTNRWETITPKGPMVTRPKYCGNAGYFDPAHNVLVIYNSTNRIWVYRHKRRAGAAKTAKE